MAQTTVISSNTREGLTVTILGEKNNKIVRAEAITVDPKDQQELEAAATLILEQDNLNRPSHKRLTPIVVN